MAGFFWVYCPMMPSVVSYADDVEAVPCGAPNAVEWCMFVVRHGIGSW